MMIHYFFCCKHGLSVNKSDYTEAELAAIKAKALQEKEENRNKNRENLYNILNNQKRNNMACKYSENSSSFKFIVAKIKRVNIGVKSTKVYTKEFYPFDLEDLESTTEMIDTSKGIIIVQEPFILKDDEEEYFQAVVDKWNEEPPKSILNN